MSGTEVAGLILGAIPIFIEAVDFYKEGIQKSKIFFRRRSIVGKLALALLLQQRTLAETVKAILTRSGCQDIWRLETDPVGCLGDTEIKSQVSEWLGHENDVAFCGVLEQSDEIIRKIARNLAGLVGSPKVQLPSSTYYPAHSFSLGPYRWPRTHYQCKPRGKRKTA